MYYLGCAILSLCACVFVGVASGIAHFIDGTRGFFVLNGTFVYLLLVVIGVKLVAKGR